MKLHFKVWVCAKRVRLLKECFLHYRQDNESSSINSPGKVYCICDEYDEMEKFLNLHPIAKGIVEPIMIRIKFDSYNWNYERLSEPLQAEFIQRFSDDFKRHQLDGLIQKDYFEWYKLRTVNQIIQNPALYHELKIREKNGEQVSSFENVSRESQSMITKALQLMHEWIMRGFDCIRKRGFVYTTKLFIQEVIGRIFG